MSRYCEYCNRNGKTCCSAHEPGHPDGWRCTREAGHAGPHVACAGAAGHKLSTWREDLVSITLVCDELDAQAIHRAIASRQSMRINGECILPEGESELAGAIIAEICRDWEEHRDRVDTRD